ncbi:DgyrCDS798 [Dimorphilus gyrociliatus]|uniref:DgyrCDS798 n=1 Tax=Dimorphilus gyrociliatus TaxID=2664684 RepID=A0A7I8V5E9_9ANNE|nr:DgyrCDS798 [Dimorphilus gyrociliatus]
MAIAVLKWIILAVTECGYSRTEERVDTVNNGIRLNIYIHLKSLAFCGVLGAWIFQQIELRVRIGSSKLREREKKRKDWNSDRKIPVTSTSLPLM